jgi:hypothetical protein
VLSSPSPSPSPTCGRSRIGHLEPRTTTIWRASSRLACSGQAFRRCRPGSDASGVDPVSRRRVTSGWSFSAESQRSDSRRMSANPACVGHVR